eukprot:6666363-Pyramimonas_sp.AAC.1
MRLWASCMEKTLRSNSENKVTGHLRLRAGGEQDAVFLSRIIRAVGSPGDERFEGNADPRRAEMIAAG